MRARTLGGVPLARAWQCALAGRAALWAVLAAALATRPRTPLTERALAWARAEITAACSEAAAGSRDEAFLPAPAELDAELASVLAPIGDVDPQLPAERWDLDPLLRR
jgi:hypothetical protein